MLVGFVVGATARGVRIDALEIESAADLDLRGAFGIDPSVALGAARIRYTIRVRGDTRRVLGAGSLPELAVAVRRELDVRLR